MHTNENVSNLDSTIELDPIATAGVEDLESETRRLICGLIDFLHERKPIMDKITKVLDEENYKYVYNPEEPGHLYTGFCAGIKEFKLDIILFNCKIILWLSFPFRCLPDAIPIVAMYLPIANEKLAFSRLNLNEETGEITMEYSYLCGKAEYFNKNDFKLYLDSLIQPAIRYYTKLSDLCKGIVSPEERSTSIKHMKNALKILDGEKEQDIENLKEWRFNAGLESPLQDFIDEILINIDDEKETPNHLEKCLEKESTSERSYKELFSSFAKKSRKEDVSTTGGTDE